MSSEPTNLIAQYYLAGKAKKNAFSLCIGIQNGFLVIDEELKEMRLFNKDLVNF